MSLAMFNALLRPVIYRLASLALLLTIVLAAAAFPASPALAALPIGTLAKLSAANVTNARITTDSTRVVYTSYTTSSTAVSLYSIPFAGGAATQLNTSPVPTPATIDLFLITPDDQYVIFLARPQSGSAAQLYSAPIGGGSVIRLNANLATGFEVLDFAIGASGQSIVYRVAVLGGGSSGGSEIFTVAPTGGTPRRLNAALTAGAGVNSYQLSKSGDIVAYDLVNASSQTLLSAALAGGSSTPLSSIDTSANALSRYFLSPDGAWLVYETSDNASGAATLFRIAASGGAPQALAKPADATAFHGVQITSDSARVVYTANTRSGRDEIFSVPLSAAQPFVKLSGALADTAILSSFQVSPDSTRLVFRGTGTSSRYQLFSIPITGGSATIIGPDPLGFAQGIGDPFYITPDSARIVYYDNGQYRSVPLAGGAAAITLADNLASSGGLAYSTNVAFSADGSYMFFRNTLADDSARSPLFVAPVDRAGAAQQISGTVAYVVGQPSFDYPIGFGVTGAGTRVFFRGAADKFSGRELYSVSLGDSMPNKAYLPLTAR